jgi:hypothetical protein
LLEEIAVLRFTLQPYASALINFSSVSQNLDIEPMHVSARLVPSRKTAHLAINASIARPLTEVDSILSKYLRANPRAVWRLLNAFHGNISTYLRCYNDDTLCKPLFIKGVLHLSACKNYIERRIEGSRYTGIAA